MVKQKSERAIEVSRLEAQQETACASLVEVADKLANLTFDVETTKGGWHTLSSAVRISTWRQQLYDALSALGWRDDGIPRQVLAQSISVLKAENPTLAIGLQFTPGGRCRVCNRVPLNRKEPHECWDEHFLVIYQEEPDPVEVLTAALSGRVDSETVSAVLGALADQPRDTWERSVHRVWEGKRPPPDLPKR